LGTNHKYFMELRKIILFTTDMKGIECFGSVGFERDKT